jgi:hypothetical protein
MNEEGLDKNVSGGGGTFSPSNKSVKYALRFSTTTGEEVPEVEIALV